MGVRILHDRKAEMATIYCSTSEWSLGPIFHDNRGLGLEANEIANRFLKWLPSDARVYETVDLERKVSLFLQALPQIIQEEKEELEEEERQVQARWDAIDAKYNERKLNANS